MYVRLRFFFFEEKSLFIGIFSKIREIVSVQWLHFIWYRIYRWCNKCHPRNILWTRVTFALSHESCSFFTYFIAFGSLFINLRRSKWVITIKKMIWKTRNTNKHVVITYLNTHQYSQKLFLFTIFMLCMIRTKF